MKKQFARLLLSLMFISNLCADDRDDSYYFPQHNSTETVQDDPCCEEPQEGGLFSGVTFEIDYLIVQPFNSNLNYTVLARPSSLYTPEWRVKSIKPHYCSAFDLALYYKLPCANNDIKLDWVRIHSSDTTHSRVKDSSFASPLFSVGPQINPFISARGKAAHHFDEVNLNFGQYAEIGCLKVRFFGGVSFSRIRGSLASHYADAADNIRLRTYQKSTFTGAGPQFGLHSTLDICYGIGFVGEIAASLLVGKQRSDLTFKSASNAAPFLGLPDPNHQKISQESTTEAHSALNGKLGINYSYAFCNGSFFIFEAGYRAGSYTNTIQTSNAQNAEIIQSTATLNVSAVAKKIGDFGYAGPYISASYAF